MQLCGIMYTGTLFDFRIEVDGAPSFFGTAEIRKMPLTSQGYESIKDSYLLNLYANNASWMQRLGGVKLSELTDTVISFDAVNIHLGFLASVFNAVQPVMASGANPTNEAGRLFAGVEISHITFPALTSQTLCIS